MTHFKALVNSRFIFLVFFAVTLSSVLLAQTTTTSSGGQKNTQANSAYVTPVVTKTYTPAADRIVWDNNKGSFQNNAAYTAPVAGASSGGGSVGTSFNFRIIGRPKWERTAISNNRRQGIINNHNEKRLAVCEAMGIKITELAEEYDSARYFGASDKLHELAILNGNLITIGPLTVSNVSSNDVAICLSDKMTSIRNFYSLLTYNKTGSHGAVLREYLESYTDCYDWENRICQKEIFAKHMSTPPFANTCSIRECPQKIPSLQGLSMEAIFEIELAFTESAAMSGHKDFAKKNLQSIMDYYSGKIQLSPYYLYLAGILKAMDQHEPAANLLEQYQLAMGGSKEGQAQLKLYYQKLAMFYFSNMNDSEGKKYMDKYYGSGRRTVQEKKYTISLLESNRYSRRLENKLITPYLKSEIDSLLGDQEFVATDKEYCSMLDNARKLYVSLKSYQEARNLMDLTRKICPDRFYHKEYNKIRFMTGGADSVVAEMKAALYWKENEKGKATPITFGDMMTAEHYMVFMNNAGLYKESLEALEYMQKKGIKKLHPYMFNSLKSEAIISYYHLKDYSNARKMMGAENKTFDRHLLYWARLYAKEGKMEKAKALYKKLSASLEVSLEEEDISIMNQ